VKGPNPCSSRYISTTHHSFLLCTLSPAYTRPSKVQNRRGPPPPPHERWRRGMTACIGCRAECAQEQNTNSPPKMPTVNCSLPTARCPLFIPTVYCSLSLPTVHCPLSIPTVYCPLSLPTVRCPLFTALSPLSTVHCPLCVMYLCSTRWKQIP
jgi:hypothetical protein